MQSEQPDQNVPNVLPPSPSQAVPGLPLPAAGLVPGNHASQFASSSDDTSQASPLSVLNIQVPDDASDADLIEKEWVVKAKDIVHHTQDNPHEQQKALSKFKADYMKKRYNKDIKIEGA